MQKNDLKNMGSGALFLGGGPVRALKSVFLMGFGVLGILLAGCAGAPLPALKNATYLQNPPVDLPVGALRLVIAPELSEKSKRGIGVEHVTFLDLLQQWAKESLNPVGANTLSLVMTLEDACVREKLLPRQATFPGSLFVSQDKEAYEGRIVVQCTLQGARIKRALRLQVDGEKNVPESATPPQRRQILISLFVDLINRLTARTIKMIPPLCSAQGGLFQENTQEFDGIGGA